MRALLLFLTSFMTWYISFAQDATFYQLKGLEDSEGTTHLFFRYNYTTNFQCSEENGGRLIETYHDDIYHFNASTFEDSVYISNYNGEWCLDGFSDEKSTIDYDFIQNDISKVIYLGNEGTNNYFAPSLYDYTGAFLEFPFPIFVKTERENYTPAIRFFTTADSIYLQLQSPWYVLPLTIDSESWPNFNYEADSMYSYFDSLAVQRKIAGIHPTNESLFFFYDEENYLYRSENYLSNYDSVDDDTKFWGLFFVENSNRIYAYSSIKEGESSMRKLGVSSSSGRTGSWTFKDFPDIDVGGNFIQTDNGNSSTIYIGDRFKIFESTDSGSNFDLIFELDSEGYMPNTIMGVYKKPGTNLLYILTRDELYLLNTGKSALSLLMTQPVADEIEVEIPSSTTLHQNYPNPFNPSTVISYQLTGNSMVRLRVFDALGREVAVLENSLKTAGNHSITFDASSLSSGIYFYQLETNNQVLTKKLTLIK